MTVEQKFSDTVSLGNKTGKCSFPKIDGEKFPIYKPIKPSFYGRNKWARRRRRRGISRKRIPNEGRFSKQTAISPPPPTFPHLLRYRYCSSRVDVLENIDVGLKWRAESKQRTSRIENCKYYFFCLRVKSLFGPWHACCGPRIWAAVQMDKKTSS